MLQISFLTFNSSRNKFRVFLFFLIIKHVFFLIHNTTITRKYLLCTRKILISYLCYFISSIQMRLLLSCFFMMIWTLNPIRFNNSIKVVPSFLLLPTSGNPKFHRAEVPAGYLFKMFWNLHSPLPVFQGWKNWNLMNHLYLEKRSSGLWNVEEMLFSNLFYYWFFWCVVRKTVIICVFYILSLLEL